MDGQDLLNVMIKIKEDELTTLKGGVNISGAVLNSLSSLIRNILDIGRGIGSSLRRLSENNVCEL